MNPYSIFLRSPMSNRRTRRRKLEKLLDGAIAVAIGLGVTVSFLLLLAL